MLQLLFVDHSMMMDGYVYLKYSKNIIWRREFQTSI